MILLMMLVVCLNGTILLEQPYGTMFEYYPRWRDFITMLIEHGGPGAVSQLNLHNTHTILSHPI